MQISVLQEISSLNHNLDIPRELSPDIIEPQKYACKTLTTLQRSMYGQQLASFLNWLQDNHYSQVNRTSISLLKSVSNFYPNHLISLKISTFSMTMNGPALVHSSIVFIALDSWRLAFIKERKVWEVFGTISNNWSGQPRMHYLMKNYTTYWTTCCKLTQTSAQQPYKFLTTLSSTTSKMITSKVRSNHCFQTLLINPKRKKLLI